jgi:hypothetical protein
MMLLRATVTAHKSRRHSVRAELVEAQPLSAQPTSTRSANENLIHPMMTGDLARGIPRNRTILAHLQLLPRATLATQDAALMIIGQHKPKERGVGFIDVHLMASTRPLKALLWTRDKRWLLLPGSDLWWSHRILLNTPA